MANNDKGKSFINNSATRIKFAHTYSYIHAKLMGEINVIIKLTINNTQDRPCHRVKFNYK